MITVERSSDADRSVPLSRVVLYKLPMAGLAVLAVLFFVGALDLGVGSLEAPGPGLWPAIAAGLTLALAVVDLVTAKAEWQMHPGNSSIGPGLLSVALVAYGVALPVGGYVLATFALLLVTSSVVGRLPWRLGLLTSLLLALGTYGLFARLLSIPLPQGLLFS